VPLTTPFDENRAAIDLRRCTWESLCQLMEARGMTLESDRVELRGSISPADDRGSATSVS